MCGELFLSVVLTVEPAANGHFYSINGGAKGIKFHYF